MPQPIETNRRNVVRHNQLSSWSLPLAVAIAALSGVVGCGNGNSTPNDGSSADTGGAGGNGSGGTPGVGGAPAGGVGGAPAGAGGTVGGTGGRGTGGSGTGAGGAAATPDAGRPDTGTGAGGNGTTGAGGAAGRADAGAPDTGGGAAGATGNAMSFFVSSDTSATGNLGGLAGADMRCQRLATAVGRGGVTWHAYLSTTAGSARDRIGAGPWFNANGVMLAANLTALHARTGDHLIFINERGGQINGQFTGSPGPLEHDILTGSLANGTIAAGLTCADWTSTAGNSEVGHSDGLGPNMGTANGLSSWNAAHTGRCNDTAPGGGAGRIYCFAIN